MERGTNLTTEKVKVLLEQGKYPAQIARELGVTRQAIDYHIKKIHLKEKKQNQKEYSKKPSRHWEMYNMAIVNEGKLIFDLILDPQILEKEAQWLTEANNKKVGAPFKYSDGLIKLALTLKTLLKKDYRRLEGIMQSLLSKIGLPAPDYTTIWYRAQKLEQEIITFVSRKENKNKEIVLDSTGRSQQIKGNYRQTKYKDNSRRFIKVHVALNVSTGEVEAVSLTDENTPDIEKAEELIEKSAKNGKPDVTYGDRGFDSTEFRGKLLKNNIIPIIRPKITLDLERARAELKKILREYIGYSEPSGKKEFLYQKTRLLKKKHPTILGKINRLTAMIECIENYKDWSSRNKYGKRAYVENFFSRETLIFGDTINNKKLSQAEKEISTRYTILNAFITLTKTKTESEHQSVYKYILNRFKEAFYEIKSSTKQAEVSYVSSA